MLCLILKVNLKLFFIPLLLNVLFSQYVYFLRFCLKMLFMSPTARIFSNLFFINSLILSSDQVAVAAIKQLLSLEIMHEITIKGKLEYFCSILCIEDKTVYESEKFE